jgi:hypothetical protein
MIFYQGVPANQKHQYAAINNPLSNGGEISVPRSDVGIGHAMVSSSTMPFNPPASCLSKKRKMRVVFDVPQYLDQSQMQRVRIGCVKLGLEDAPHLTLTEIRRIIIRGCR